MLDGHHRYAICEQHGLGYRIQDLSLPDLDAAKGWMIANQLGRRNLTPEQMSYYRGKQYAMQKRQGQRTDSNLITMSRSHTVQRHSWRVSIR